MFPCPAWSSGSSRLVLTYPCRCCFVSFLISWLPSIYYIVHDRRVNGVAWLASVITRGSLCVVVHIHVVAVELSFSPTPDLASLRSKIFSPWSRPGRIVPSDAGDQYTRHTRHNCHRPNPHVVYKRSQESRVGISTTTPPPDRAQFELQLPLRY